MTKRGKIVYIGDFDIRNGNVQSFLVLNNGKVFNILGYNVDFIGINRMSSVFSQEDDTILKKIGDHNSYYELPDTLNVSGIFKIHDICNRIVERLEDAKTDGNLRFVITYQSPTYSVALKKIVKWCRNNSVPYIVNCADLPIFSQQPFHRRTIMKLNWHYLHKVNKEYSDGVIAVSRYIKEFYQKEDCEYLLVPPLFDVLQEHDFQCSSEVPVFVYAGCPFKNSGVAIKHEAMKDRLDYIIDIFLAIEKDNIPYSFFVIGMEKDDYITGVPRHKELLEKHHNIIFLGTLDHDSVLKKVSGADYTISFREENTMNKAGFPTKVVESISLGTPVIMNPISDVFDYLKDGITGFSLCGILEKDVDIVVSLCNMSADERRMLKEKCFAEKTFGIDSYVDKFRVFFENIMIRMS